MTKDALARLRRNIEHAGFYEPLVVRPCAFEPGKYQVMHGHNRLRVLRALGHPRATCVLWDADDEQTRLYLAVMNRLAGSEVPEKRAMLLESLLQHMSVEELVTLLPDRRHALEELMRLSKLEMNDLGRPAGVETEDAPIPVMIRCKLEEAGARCVDLALDLIIEESGGHLSRGRALVELARFFIQQHGPQLGPGVG
jgi:hypothetical protein